jgi:glycosyltransferase involved in cell wall biosynthesis
MKISFVNINRSTVPTGICVAVSNLIKAISVHSENFTMEIIVGEWQLEYYKKTLFADFLISNKIHIKGIDIKNTSFERNKWFLKDMQYYMQESDIIILAYPIPFLKFQYRKLKVYSILHDLYPFDYPQNFGFPSFYLNRLQFYANLLSTDGYFCVSKTSENSLKERFSFFLKRKTIDNIYNIVPYNSDELSACSFDSRLQVNRFWLCVAQHRANKNLDLVIQSFINLNKQNKLDSQTKLVIVGSDGPETHTLKKLILDNKLDEKILLLKGLRNEELTWLYRNTSLFIMSSSIEGFGLPLIEAGRYSGRIIASDIPIFRELIDNIIFFDISKKNVNDLSDAIVYSNQCQLTPVINSELNEEVIVHKFLSIIMNITNSVK